MPYLIYEHMFMPFNPQFVVPINCFPLNVIALASVAIKICRFLWDFFLLYPHFPHRLKSRVKLVLKCLVILMPSNWGNGPYKVRIFVSKWTYIFDLLRTLNGSMHSFGSKP